MDKNQRTSDTFKARLAQPAQAPDPELVEAFRVIQNACREYRGTAADHQLLTKHLVKIGDTLNEFDSLKSRLAATVGSSVEKVAEDGET